MIRTEEILVRDRVIAEQLQKTAFPEDSKSGAAQVSRRGPRFHGPGVLHLVAHKHTMLDNKRKFAVALALFAAVGTGAYAPRVLGQDPQRAATDDFRQTVLPVLAKNCFSCHSDKLHTGNLSLEAFRDPAVALQHPEVWMKVLDKLNAGMMPPRPM